MNTIHDYYQILGISQQASIEELKRAYRQKAKHLHPDKNKSATAHQDFILLNEAYEYIINYKTGKISASQSHTYNTDWVNVERERAKAKAREYARMKHEEFINSPHYKSLTSLATVIDSLYIIFGVGLFIFFPIALSFKYGITGFITVLLFFIGTFPILRYILRNHISSYNFRNFYHSLLYLIQTKGFLIAITTLINILVILNIGVQTLISANLFFSGFALIILLSFRVIKMLLKTGNSFKLYFYSCCLVPLAINVLLAFNFVFSTNPIKETYYFTKTRDGNRESTYIHLDLDKYDEYPGIRLFLSYEAMRYTNTITYTFKDGLLGLRVMTDYSFTNEYQYGEQ